MISGTPLVAGLSPSATENRLLRASITAINSGRGHARVTFRITLARALDISVNGTLCMVRSVYAGSNAILMLYTLFRVSRGLVPVNSPLSNLCLFRHYNGLPYRHDAQSQGNDVPRTC